MMRCVYILTNFSCVTEPIYRKKMYLLLNSLEPYDQGLKRLLKERLKFGLRV